MSPGCSTASECSSFGTMYAAPTAGRMLRDFGPTSSRSRIRRSGDYARQWTPQHDGLSLGFARLNAGKRSLGRRSARRARARAGSQACGVQVDVIIESFRSRPDGDVGPRLRLAAPQTIPAS